MRGVRAEFLTVRSCLTLLLDNPRPIRTVRTEPTNEETAPPLSQESDNTTGTGTHVKVSHEGVEITVMVRPRNRFSSLLRTACKHLEVDKDTLVLPQYPLSLGIVIDPRIAVSSSSEWSDLTGEIPRALWSVTSLGPWKMVMSTMTTNLSSFPMIRMTERNHPWDRRV